MADTTIFSPVCHDVFGMPVLTGEWYWAIRSNKILGAGQFRDDRYFVLCSVLVPTDGMQFYPAILPTTL